MKLVITSDFESDIPGSNPGIPAKQCLCNSAEEIVSSKHEVGGSIPSPTAIPVVLRLEVENWKTRKNLQDYALVVELVDTLVLETSAERRRSSSLLGGTKHVVNDFSGCGGIGRHTRFKIWRRKACEFESRLPDQTMDEFRFKKIGTP